MRGLIQRSQSINVQTILGYSLSGWALTAGLSAFFAQIFFYLFLTLSLFTVRAALGREELRWLLIISLAWIFSMLVSIGASIDPLRSTSESLKFMLYLYAPFAIAYYLYGQDRVRKVMNLIILLALGQAVAGLHTVVSEALGSSLRLGLVGEVTESGQLALVIPALLGVIFSGSEFRYRREASLLALSFLLLAWGDEIFGSMSQVLAFAGCVFSIGKLFRGTLRAQALQLGLLALLSAAFIINLKRGPWFGVFVGLVTVGLMLKPRLALKTVILSILAAVGLPPVRERLFNFAADFTISGGRERMWELGIEIVQRFPLGVGLRNASFMRTLDPYLPVGHQHLHNNFLNILVEVGYLGFIVYIWWLVAIITFALGFAKLVRDPSSRTRRVGYLGTFIAVSLISSSCAGVVEYNFGDADIRRIFFLLLGLLISLPRSSGVDESSDRSG